MTKDPCLSGGGGGGNMMDLIDHSDQSHINAEDLNASEIARQKKFDLTIPTEDEAPNKKFRLEKKSFAIACHTNMTKENIMQHIQNVFNELVQYVCISSPDTLSTRCSPVYYIQIILQKTINKKCYFLKTVAGMQCNYRVTCDDRAWNMFLKKVGNYIEVGQFQSVRSRVGIKWSEVIRQKYKEKRREKSTTKRINLQTTKSQQMAEDIMAQVRVSLQNAIDHTKRQIPVECSHQRNILLKRLNALYTLA